MSDQSFQDVNVASPISLNPTPSSQPPDDSVIIKDLPEVSFCFETPTQTDIPKYSDTNMSNLHKLIWGKSSANEYRTAYYNVRTKIDWQPYNSTTFAALSKIKSIKEKFSNPEWVKNRETVLETKKQKLKQMEREKNPEQLSELERLKLKLKTTLKAIKKWELKFFEKMGKKPSHKDIDQLPKVKAMYQYYQSLSKRVKSTESQLSSSIDKSSFLDQSFATGINQSIFDTTNMSSIALNMTAMDISLLNTSRMDTITSNISNISLSSGLRIIGPPKVSEVDNKLPGLSPTSEKPPQSSQSNSTELSTPPEPGKYSEANDYISDIPISDIWEMDIPSSQCSVIPEDHPLSKIYTSSPYYVDNYVNQSVSTSSDHLNQWLTTTQNLVNKYFPNIEDELKIQLNNPTVTLTEPLAPRHPLLPVLPGYHASTKSLKQQISSDNYEQRDYPLEIEPYHDWEDDNSTPHFSTQEPLSEGNDDEASASNQTSDKTPKRRPTRTAKSTKLTNKDLVSQNFVKLNIRSRFRSRLPNRPSRFSKSFHRK